MKCGAGDPSPDYKPTEEFRGDGSLVEPAEVRPRAVGDAGPHRVM